MVVANGDVLVAVHTGFSFDRAAATKLAGRSFEWTVMLTLTPTDVPRAPSEHGVMRMHPHCPRRSTASPRVGDIGFDAGRDVCIPPPDPLFTPRLDDFNDASLDASLGASAATPSTASEVEASRVPWAFTMNKKKLY